MRDGRVGHRGKLRWLEGGYRGAMSGWKGAYRGAKREMEGELHGSHKRDGRGAPGEP